MSHGGEIFSDIFAQKQNFISRMEARIKLVFTLVALIINLLSPTIYAPLAILGSCLFVLASIRVPMRLIILRLAMPLVMAFIVLVSQMFLNGVSPLFTLSFGGLRLTGYEEGLARGLLIMCRALGGVSLVLLLSMTTPADKLFMAASWFKIPRTFIELALLIYRYVFVLIEELTTMKDAQRIRLGYHNWSQSMRSLGMLGACLIMRAYERAERVFESMLARGYTGTNSAYSHAFGKEDGLTAFCLGLILAGFYLVGRIGA